ncbi:MAG TPA: polysaccharide biosynthesis/export family protein [Verrucomicrobiales bacterium]|nr:polysaccharide biosynthesis/export family protein [Verrucomicrobiales bacterium]
MNNNIENHPGHLKRQSTACWDAEGAPAVHAGFPALKKAFCRIAFAATVTVFIPACQQAVPITTQPSPVSPYDGTGPVILGEGDLVKLFFPGAPEYTGSQKIRLDGKLSLPIIGEYQAAGKTVTRLQSELSGRYKSQLQNSEVVVSLEASGKPVIISGGVASPGKFVFDRPTTMLEAIMGAGGFKDFARKGKVRLTRIVNGQYHTVVYDMRGGRAPVVYVRGGDMIDIPLSNW